MRINKPLQKKFSLAFLLLIFAGLFALLLLSGCSESESVSLSFSDIQSTAAEPSPKAAAEVPAEMEPAEAEESAEVPDAVGQTEAEESSEVPALTFRNSDRLNEHYEKHGIEMGFSSAEEYQAAAAAVASNPDALHKTEAEDGDDVYYLESTNDFVIVSTDGYIRTYFRPDAGIDYYNRQ